MWFQDPRDERFHELRWRHAREVERPFGASALGYVKRLLVDSGMRRPSEEEIATGLARLLHELSDEDLFRDRRARREAVRQAVIAEQRRAPTQRRRSQLRPRRRSSTRGQGSRSRRWSSSGDRPGCGAVAAADGQGRLAAVRRRRADRAAGARSALATTGGLMIAQGPPMTLSGCGTRTGSGRSARSTPTSTARSSGSSSPTSCAVQGRVTARRLTATRATGRRRSSAISVAITSGAAGRAIRTS